MTKIPSAAIILVLCLGTAAAQEPPAGSRIRHPKDEAVMVWVPSGPFVMGLDEPEADLIARHLGFKTANDLWAWDSYPKRKVHLEGFFIDQHEATVARWHQFVKATGHRSAFKETSRHFDQADKQDLPAGEITWEEAKAYAKWAGRRLPTDAEWEKAARGTDGRLYPWGNEPPTADHGHFGGKKARPELYARVGSFPKGASPYGALDMVGNQYEWTADWMEPYPGNPQGDRMKDYAGKKNVSLRGGSWYHGWISFYAAKRFGLRPDETYYHVGFRTVWTPPPGYFETEEYRAAARTAGKP